MLKRDNVLNMFSDDERSCAVKEVLHCLMTGDLILVGEHFTTRITRVAMESTTIKPNQAIITAASVLATREAIAAGFVR